MFVHTSTETFVTLNSLETPLALVAFTDHAPQHYSSRRETLQSLVSREKETLFGRWPPCLKAPFDAESNSALNPSRIRPNPSAKANLEVKYPLDGSKKQVFRGYRVVFRRWPPSLRAPFDAESNSALNPSRIRPNPSAKANREVKYPLDGSKKQVFRGYRVGFGRWPPCLWAPFDAEFNSALNPSRIRPNPSGIANREKNSRISC